ncbi:hypothetical protein [Microbulbifer elongatus]|uniref:hypothetical protein n=1 Tax=Microbulbifer elongatus TaxID=86173 RepID=UPI001CFF3F77|nr:hypothetical protein [Microbulbifer elongatus]
MSLADWSKRATLPHAPKNLRYKEFQIECGTLFVNQMGFCVVLQRINGATSHREAVRHYQHKFDFPYAKVVNELRKRFGSQPIGDTSFLVNVGNHDIKLDWKVSHIPSTSIAISILVEALFIDELCRVLERKSDTLLGGSSLASDLLVAEYADSLFPLGHPAGFLVASEEITQMENYYETWRLETRVATLHQRFTEAIMNRSLYQGHLERNRQNILNVLLATIAFLSLSQSSEPISKALSVINISISETSLSFAFINAAIVFLVFGSWKSLIKPWVGMKIKNSKRYRMTKVIYEAKSENRRERREISKYG